MLRSSTIGLLLAGATLGACETDLGPCDYDEARTVYFNSSGTPYYGGQALVAEYCDSCHGARSEGAARVGAPAGLNFDMTVAQGDIMALAHLRAGQQNIFDWRGEAQEWVEAGTMPPPGERFIRSGAQYSDLEGNILPGLDSAEGKSLLRNWLSCGSPVVERSEPPVLEQVAGAECNNGTEEVGDCRVLKEETVVIEPNWSSLYSNYFGKGATCLACHQTQAQADAFGTTFVMGSSAQTAYDAMVGVMTDSAGDCSGQIIVVENDPDASNLVHKLEGEGAGGAEVCGDPMPATGAAAPGAVVQAVRDWISAGAENN